MQFPAAMLRRVIKLKDCLIAADFDIGDSVALSWSTEIAINLNYRADDKDGEEETTRHPLKCLDSLGDQTNGETEYIQSQTSHR